MILIVSMSRQIIHLYFPHILSTACSIQFVFSIEIILVYLKISWYIRQNNGGIMGRLGGWWYLKKFLPIIFLQTHIIFKISDGLFIVQTVYSLFKPKSIFFPTLTSSTENTSRLYTPLNLSSFKTEKSITPVPGAP